MSYKDINYHKKYRENNLALGKCSSHPNRNVVPGKTICKKCILYNKNFHLLHKKEILFKKQKLYNPIIRKINYLKNIECIKEWGKNYNKTHKDEKKEYGKKYRKTINGKLSDILHKNKRREVKNNVIHNYTKEEWTNKVKKTNGICLEKYGGCGKWVGYKNLTLDHFYPLFRAYQDYLRTGIKRIYTINDVNPICGSCNSGWGCKNKIL
jgi:hypothetical protein